MRIERGFTPAARSAPFHSQSAVVQEIISITTNTWGKTDSFDLGIMTFTHGLSDGYANLLLPVLTLIVAELSLSKFDAGILLSSFSIATFFSLYPISLLADYSGRKKVILILGLSTASLAFLCMTWVDTFWALLALAFLAGAGNSTYHPCGTALTATRFAHHRAIAISIHGTGGHLGMSLMPIAQAGLIAAGIHWRASIAVCAIPAIVLLTLIGFRLPGKSKAAAKDQQSLSAHLSALTQQVFSNRNVVLLGVLYFLSGMATKGIIGFLPLLAQEKFQMSSSTIGLALSVYFAAGVIAKPLMGLLYKRFGARSALLAPTLFVGVFTFGIVWAPTPTVFLAFIAMFGIVSPISPIIMTAVADMGDEDVLASSVGYIYTIRSLCFLSPILGGWVAEHVNLRTSYVLLILFVWFATLVATLLREPDRSLRKRHL
ncbi:MAG: MFS transporter [bacterium]|nr:MFS transporter [bacterium]